MITHSGLYRYTLMICLCSVVYCAQAQLAIHGQVTTAGLPLGGVRVDARLDGASAFMAYTFTDGNGGYRLALGQTGRIVVSFRALSYEPVTKIIELRQTDTLLNLALVPGGVERLQEIIINAKRPYGRGRDTIELDVKSFLQGDERTVEDLLRKIPGLNVGTDGSIKIGEKEVEKVMIEGDDFFEKGYRLLTQNMSVQPLDKVQVLQRYSNNKHLKGIENSDKVALNLQLKEDSKNQWLGSVSASGTPVEPFFYQASINVMNFGKRNKYYLLGTANNHGLDALSSINYLLYSGQTDEPGQIGVGITTPTLIDNTPDLPGFDYRRTNFNQDKLLSFNTILNPSKRLKIKWLGFANPTKKSFYRNTVQEYDIEDIQFTYTEGYELNRKINNYYSRWEMHYDVSNRSTLIYTGSLGSLGKYDSGALVFNGERTTELTKMKGYLTNQLLTHTYKLSDNEAIVSSARWIMQKSPLHYQIDQYYYDDLFQVGDVSNVYQHAKNDLQYAGITSHYVKKKKGGDFMEVAVANEYKSQTLVTDFILQREDGSQIRPSGFSNQVNFRTNNTHVMTKYTIKRRMWQLTPQLRAGFMQRDLSNDGVSRNQNNWLISSSLFTKWLIHHKGKLEGELSFQQMSSELMDVVPNYFNTGIQNFVKGLDDMATLNNSAAVITYTYGNMLDKFFANFSLGHKTMFDYISNQRSLNPNFNLTEQILLKDKKTMFYKAQFNYYVKLLNGNFRVDMGADFSEYETSIVGVGKRRIESGSYDYGLSFRSVWKSRLNIHSGSHIQIRSFNSEHMDRLKNTYSFLHIFFNVAEDIQANMKNEAYRFGDFLSESPKTYFFSDVSLSYDVKKIKTKFNISAKNLFNNRQFSNAIITDTYRAITEYRLLPRYAALGLDYRF
ncbi:carboxypeptidase-like regulatory domain-containing protein [Pedobacter frigoris]|uniref:Carboxypeptidase regulatory-like domain-containing protein n=1 Tax=Pedobacter frigoris TaxID=2571272 RepID=A0A4U1CPK2_9SPHI|nr:carboxypeptidase-like regulatory domain-containing protein [Pedobacter frigoris]TKC08810.1 carboxypeptidase regulatory-like domain-containing protein [Pedobacter frigoris]